MDNRKFEKLIELIINENEEQARALFHDIVVEKSREIYENIIAEEMEEEGFAGQTADMLDEIGADVAGEEEGIGEGEEEFDIADDDGEEAVDFEADKDFGGEEGDVEGKIEDIKDKLDELMAEFEEIMGGGEEDFGDEEGEEDFGGEEGEEDFGDEEEGIMEGEDEEEDDEDSLEESIQLKKVPVTHGDNGAYTKSPSLNQPKVKSAGVNPVKFSGTDEAVPTSPKGATNAYAKGETQVKHAGQWKNAPAQTGQKLETAPKPKHGDDGSNTKSVIESRKITKKRI
jgi:hypothetical protein